MSEAKRDAPLPVAQVAAIPSLQEALKRGDLGVIAQALGVAAAMRSDDLDGVRRRLDDAAQVDAVMQLQAARWGDGDAASALAALRAAFAKGPRWRKPTKASTSLLPPLYPER